MSLIRAEWARFFARRFTRIMVVVVLGILGLVGLGTFLSTSRPSPEVVAQAEQQAELQRQQVVQMRAECEQAVKDPTSEAGKRFGQLPPGVTCETIFNPNDVKAEYYMPHVFSLRDESSDLLMVAGGVLILFGFAVGASFIGAEWSSGGVMNLLLWRPRRLPLLAGKLVTMLLAVTTTAATLFAAWFGALWGIAAVRGRYDGMTSGVIQSLSLTGLRSLALVLGAAAIGFCVASLGRNTATALGLAIGYGLVLEIGMRIVLEIAEVIKPERWFLSTYATAWLNKGVTYDEFRHCRFDTTGDCQPFVWGVTMNQAAMVFGAIVLILLVAAFWSFQRRDVT